MRSRTAFVALIASVAMSGCGEKQEQPSDRELARTVLLSKRDLPPGSSIRESPVAGASCGPASYMKKAVMTESPMFVVEKSNVQQVAGVFRSTTAAESAVRSLTSALRRRCLLGTLRIFGARVSEGAGQLPTGSPQIKGEWSLMSFELKEDGAPPSHVDIALVRDGRGLTETLYLTEKADSPYWLIADLASSSDEALAKIPS